MQKETLIVQEHHWRNASYWSLLKGDPHTVVKRLIDSWNSKDTGCQYPHSQEFTNSVARLIQAAKRKETVAIIPDGNSDDLCKACGACRMVSLPECR